MVKQARRQHGDWLELIPEQQAALEGPFMFGDECPIPPIGNTLEHHVKKQRCWRPCQGTSNQNAGPM
eukprot:317560-Prorocentrum_lima.AAC.1